MCYCDVSRCCRCCQGPFFFFFSRLWCRVVPGVSESISVAAPLRSEPDALNLGFLSYADSNKKPSKLKALETVLPHLSMKGWHGSTACGGKHFRRRLQTFSASNDAPEVLPPKISALRARREVLGYGWHAMLNGVATKGTAKYLRLFYSASHEDTPC